MEQMFDEDEIDGQCTCLDCGWKGYESELIAEEDIHDCSMIVAGNCPVCGGENVG